MKPLAAVVVVIGMLSAGVARADGPADLAMMEATAWTNALGASPARVDDVMTMSAAPFWYEGTTFTSADAACKKLVGRHGTLPDADHLKAALPCFAPGMDGLVKSDAVWTATTLAKLPRPFRSFRTKLRKLGTDVVLVTVHRVADGQVKDALYAVRISAHDPKVIAWLGAFHKK